MMREMPEVVYLDEWGEMGGDTKYIRADTVTEELQELAERRQADADASDPIRNIIW